MKFKEKTFYKVFIILILSTFGIVLFSLPSLEEKKNASKVSESKYSLETKSSLRDSLDSFAMELLGVPYIYAGSSKAGFDCSGFVYYVFNNFSIQVPRSTSQYENVGKEISIENVKKGDLLLFLSPTRDAIGHIGIVTNPKGMETEFVHASSGKEMEVIVSSLKQSNYNRRFVRAVRVIKD